jgi:alkylation response protein AidB-like acyl-CoA dehydrogenase
LEFGFSEDQLLFQKSFRDFLEGECAPDRIRALWQTETGRSPELWKGLAELGVTGLLVPEAHEGLGLTEIDSVLLMEEVGRAGLAEPLVSTAAVAAPMLVELAEADLCDAWLKKVAVGEAVIAVGHPLSPFVSDAHVANLLLLESGREVHAVGRDAVQIEAQPANDPARRIARVQWTPSPETRVAEGDRAAAILDAALDRGALACAAQALGVADKLIDLAVDYARQREQFGVPIGSFQAVKHMLSDCKVKLEYARPVVHRAAHSVARGSQGRGLHVSMAKLAATEAASFAARVSLQVHGAIGYTWEQDLHIWMRRAWSLGTAWGRGAFHRARVADAILAADAPVGPGRTFPGGE